MQGLCGVMLYCLKLTEYLQNDAIFEARDTGLAKPISFGVPTTSNQDAFIFMYRDSALDRISSLGVKLFPSKLPWFSKYLGFVEKMSSQKGNDRLPTIRFQVLLLMDEILHQLISSLSHYV